MQVKGDVENAHPLVNATASHTASSDNLPEKHAFRFEPVVLKKVRRSRLNRNGAAYRLHEGHRQRRNNISLGVGFLEFANALDFAANIWNTAPLPRFVIGLMATGGSVTLLLSIFAVFDFRRSWDNTRMLRDERKHLHKLRSENQEQRASVHGVDSLLRVNYRELTSEIVDRVTMDFLMGFAGLQVGIGTLIAIPGAHDHRVYLASNYLSGYIGNAFPLLWGVINCITSVYLSRRFHRQARLVAEFGGSEPLQADIIDRCRQFQRHAWLTAINGLVAGVAGMMTFKYWWAYVILIPCIITSLFANLYFRMRIGYDRYLVSDRRDIPAPHSLSLELMNAHIFCVSLRRRALPKQVAAALESFEKPDMAVVSALLEPNHLVPLFCEWLFNSDEQMARQVFLLEDHPEQVVITGQDFVHADVDRREFSRRFKEFLLECGPRHFESRRKYLLELMAYNLENQKR